MREPTAEERDAIARHEARFLAARRALPAHAVPCYGVLRLDTTARTRELLLGPETAIGADTAVIDWRSAPLAAVFFAHDEGESFELELEGRTIEGTVVERALYRSERGELVEVEGPFSAVRDAGVWRVEEAVRPVLLLAPRPPELRDAKLELDPEQRRAVELPADRSLLVLGEAGFGKTTVALYRLAALEARARDEGRTFTSLVIVPTRGLERLTRRTLERLDVHGARVLTYDAWISAEVRRVFSDLPARNAAGTTPAILRLKRHPAVREELPALAERGARAKPARKAAKRRDLLELFGDREILERVVHRAAGAIPKHAIDQTLEHTRVQFSPTTERAHAHVDRDRLETIDGRMIDEGTPMEDAETIDVEDGAILFELHRLRTGSDGTARAGLQRYDHVILDEAQELAPIELAIVGRACKAAGAITAAGDAEQQTDDTAFFPGWPEVMAELGVAAHERVTLTESHRCPPEVTWFARNLVGRARPGEVAPAATGALQITDFPTPFHLTVHLVEALRRLESADPRATIAVVTRTAESARRMQASLQRGLAVRLALGGDFDFRPGTVVTCVAEVKGLEFDVVVVPDADAATYPDTAESRRALYVAVTRPLWQLRLLAAGPRSPLV